MTEKETYLGDGLYVSHDGYQFILRAPREGGDHWVGLEPGVLESFLSFVKTFRCEDYFGLTDNEEGRANDQNV